MPATKQQWIYIKGAIHGSKDGYSAGIPSTFHGALCVMRVIMISDVRFQPLPIQLRVWCGIVSSFPYRRVCVCTCCICLLHLARLLVGRRV